MEGLGRALRSPVPALILCVAAVVKVSILFSILPTRIRQWDFGQLYAAALVLRENGDPYTNNYASVGAALKIEMTPGYESAEMPTLLLFLEPLTKLSLERAYWLWTMLNVICLAVAMFLLLRPSVSGLSTPTAWSLAALGLLYLPVSVQFEYAQTQIVILMLLAAAMRSMTRSHEPVAGFILATAGLLRGFPLLLIGYLFVRREWRTFWYSVVGLVIGVVLTWGMVGAPCLSFARAAGWAMERVYLQIPNNFAVGAVVSRLFWNSSGFFLGEQFDIVRKIAMVVAYAVILGFTIRATLATHGKDRDWRAFSLWVISCILLSPIAWLHYFVLLIIPYFQLAIAGLGRRASKRVLYMAVGSYLLLGVSRTVGSNIRSLYPFIPVLEECGFVALMMMYIAAYWCTIDSPDSAEANVRVPPGEVNRGLTLTEHSR